MEGNTAELWMQGIEWWCGVGSKLSQRKLDGSARDRLYLGVVRERERKRESESERERERAPGFPPLGTAARGQRRRTAAMRRTRPDRSRPLPGRFESARADLGRLKWRSFPLSISSGWN
jgi:hypothetical protein